MVIKRTYSSLQSYLHLNELRFHTENLAVVQKTKKVFKNMKDVQTAFEIL